MCHAVISSAQVLASTAQKRSRKGSYGWLKARKLPVVLWFPPWLGKQDLLHHLKITGIPWHRWNNGGRYFLTSTAMQASSSFCLVAPVPSQGTVHCSCATQHPILCADLHFPLLKTQSRFPFTLGLRELWPCFQIPNALTAFWKALTVNTQWVFLANFIVTKLQMMWKWKQVKTNHKHAISVKNPFLIIWTHFAGSMPRYCFEFMSVSTNVGLQIWKRRQSLLKAKECGNKDKLLLKAPILCLVSVSVAGCKGYSGHF